MCQSQYLEIVRHIVSVSHAVLLLVTRCHRSLLPAAAAVNGESALLLLRSVLLLCCCCVALLRLMNHATAAAPAAALSRKKINLSSFTSLFKIIIFIVKNTPTSYNRRNVSKF